MNFLFNLLVAALPTSTDQVIAGRQMNSACLLTRVTAGFWRNALDHKSNKTGVVYLELISCLFFDALWHLTTVSCLFICIRMDCVGKQGGLTRGSDGTTVQLAEVMVQTEGESGLTGNLV